MNPGGLVAIGCWLIVIYWLACHFVDGVIARTEQREHLNLTRAEMRANARCYPAHTRTVMGAQQKAPEPVRTVSGARHIKGELLDGHHE